MGKHPRNALTFMPPAGATPHTFFIALCTIAVTLTLSLGACIPRSSHPTHESLAITSRTLKNIDELDTPSTPTNGGTHVSTALKNNILTVASIDSTEHTPQWALDISLTNASDSSISWPGDSDHDLAGRLSATTIGALVVSPNGNYISLALQVTRKQEEARLTDQSSTVELASQQRGYVVVLDARTGKTVLTRSSPVLSWRRPSPTITSPSRPLTPTFPLGRARAPSPPSHLMEPPLPPRLPPISGS